MLVQFNSSHNNSSDVIHSSSVPALSQTSNLRVLNGAKQLVMTRVSGDDSGSVYRCRVENIVGEDEISYTLSVLGLSMPSFCSIFIS